VIIVTIRTLDRSAWLACGAAAVLFGSATPAAKLVLDHVPPITLAGLLYLGAAVVAGPMVAGQPRPRPCRADLAKVIAAVVVGGAVGPALLLTGLHATSASSTSMLLNFELVATVLLAWLVFGEHIGRRGAIGLAAIAGAGVLLAGAGRGFGTGSVLILGACACWGLDNNLTATATGISPAQITLAKGVFAGGVNLLIGISIEHPHLTPAAVCWAVAVGAFGYGASIMLWVSGARRLGAARSQGVFATAPFVGVGLGWIITSDSVTSAQLIALVPMAIGVVLIVTSAHDHEHRHTTQIHAHRHRHDDDHHDHAHDPAVPGWHSHQHEHAPLVHSHPHVSDQFHRHDHADRS